MPRLNVSELKVQSFFTGKRSEITPPASEPTWVATACDCSGVLCTKDCVYQSRRTEELGCCG